MPRMGAGLNGLMIRGRTGLTVLLAIVLGLAALASSASASSVSSLTVNVAPARAAAQRVLDTYSFKAASAIPALTGFVRLQAPASGLGETFAGNSFDYVITDGSSASYSFFAEVDPEGLGQNVVDVHLPAEIAAGDTVKVAAYGVSNPQAPNLSAEFGLSTSSDSDLVAQEVSIGGAGLISSLTVVPVTQSAAAKGVVYKVSFKATSGLTSGTTAAGSFSDRGYILLKALKGTEFEDSSVRIVDGSQSELVGVAVNPDGLGSSVAELELPPGFTVSPGDLVQMSVFGVKNPPTAEAFGRFAVSTSSDAGSASFGVQIRNATAVSAVTVSGKPQNAGVTAAVYEVGLTPTTTLYTTTESNGCFFEYACDYVRLKAPKGTIFPSQSSEYEVSFGSVHEHPWYVQVGPEGSEEANVVNVHLPQNRGVTAGTPIHIKLWGVVNPPASPSSELAVSTSLDATAVQKPFPVGGATAISSLAVSASNSEAGASAVHQTVSFKATNLLPFDPSDGETSYVRIEAPQGSSYGGYFRVTDGSKHAYSLAVLDPQEAGANVAQVYMPFEVAAGDTLELATTSAGNPAQVSASSEFAVSSSSDGTPAKQAFPITSPTAVTGVSASAQPATARSKETVAQVGFIATQAMPGELGEELHGCDFYDSSQYMTACQHIRLTAPAGTVFAESIGDYFVANAAGAVPAWYAKVDPEQAGETNVVDIYVSHEQSIAAGETVHVTAFGVGEPNSPAAGGELAVSTSDDPTPAQAPLPIGPASTISKLVFSSSNHGAGAEAVQVTARFRASGPLTDGEHGEHECCSDRGYIRLAAPGGSSFAGGNGYAINGTPTTGEANPEGLGENVVDVMIPHGMPIAAGQQVETVASTLTNPNAVGAYEFAVSTSSDGVPRGDVYIVTNATPPEDETSPTISGTAERGQALSAGAGHWTPEPTHYAYQWLRCEGSSCTPITGATQASYELAVGDVGRTIEVQLTASNGAGSGAPARSSATGVVASSTLQADAGEPVHATEGVAATLDGDASSPSEAIVGYGWEFGDGTSASGAIVSHVYAHAGVYTATLHVSDGKSSSTDTTVVSVTAPPSHRAEVTVEANGGGALAGAEVLYISPGTGQRTAAATGPSGVATLPDLPEGGYSVSAYADGYRPGAGDITVGPSGGHTMIQLRRGEVTIATREYEPMTLAEIEAAGIDPEDPANHEVHRFLARLTLEGQAPVDYTCYLNSAGQFVGSCPPPALPGGARALPQASSYEGHPIIEWVVSEAGDAALKQLVNVHVVLENLSEAGFTLSHGSATLRLPPGLSLAPTANPQSATRPFPDVPGEGSASLSWVLRGDTPGDHVLAAAYEGRLDQLEAPIAIVAKANGPLRIWGANALALTVEADQGEALPGAPYHVTIAAKNVSPVALSDVEVAVDASKQAGFIYQPGEHFSDGFAMVAPGETVRTHVYVLVPAISSTHIFAPSLSSAAFAGESQAGSEVAPVTPPPSYPIKVLGDTPRRVHLNWVAVPGAEGYEVFSIASRSTPFSETPDAAADTATGTPTTAPLSAVAADAYLPARRGVRYYAVTAVVGGHLALASEVLAAEPGAVLPGLPEIGRCLTATPANHGGYTDSKCTKVAAGHNGAEEWSAGPGAKEGLHGTFGATKLEASSKLAIKCAAGTSSGEIEDAKLLAEVFAFTGCELSSTKAACQSTGAAAGEIRTVTLSGELGVIRAGAKPAVGLAMAPAGGTSLAQITCGSQAISLKGSVIAPISALDKATTSFKVAYKGKKGVQTPEGFEGAPKGALRWSVAGGPEEAVGLAASQVLQTEEAMEIKAIA